MVLSSWHSHCESSPCSFDECRIVQSEFQPLDQAILLGPQVHLLAASVHVPIIIYQPES